MVNDRKYVKERFWNKCLFFFSIIDHVLMSAVFSLVKYTMAPFNQGLWDISISLFTCAYNFRKIHICTDWQYICPDFFNSFVQLI